MHIFYTGIKNTFLDISNMGHEKKCFFHTEQTNYYLHNPKIKLTSSNPSLKLKKKAITDFYFIFYKTVFRLLKI